MSHIKLLAAALLCVVFLAGCGRATHRYLDNKDVKVQDVKSVKQGEFIFIEALLENSSSGAVTNTVYRVQWFDDNGMLLEQTAWRPVIIKGRNPVYVKERSTIPGAKDFTILITNDAS